ncbi:hypothetical protein [Thermocoleostomius sinensis]|uniref:Uncharacterized protein n=1 Tax=Thermocoleostomius sinensis A174 TaxID=2016057 RepID=A0A9E8ZGA5_9CYAN|nr:hypothetical protein [Thermocoleostomius sinensis]WAL60675.1 hypothetical protein OXH18_01360 [Thermocoleostomius sinensis A174]
MNTQELVDKLGKEHALAVVEWLEFTIQEFRNDRPEDEDTAEYLESLTDYLRLHAASEFVETHQGMSAHNLKSTDLMDL